VSGGWCQVPSCERPAHGDAPLCVGHLRRQARGRPVGGALRETLTPWGRLTEAALAYADAGSDAAYRRAADNLRTAAEAYARKAPADCVPDQG
jgi:hypothetical protein